MRLYLIPYPNSFPMFVEYVQDIVQQHDVHIFHVHLDYYQLLYEEEKILDLNRIDQKFFLAQHVLMLMLFQATLFYQIEIIFYQIINKLTSV